MLAGLFYRFKKAPYTIESNLRQGDTYRLKEERDDLRKYRKNFVLLSASGDEFDFNCSYQDLDELRLEDIFEEVPKPSWWDNPMQASGY